MIHQAKIVAEKMADDFILFIKQNKTNKNQIKRLNGLLNGKLCEIKKLTHLNEVFYPITQIITVFVQIAHLFLEN